MKIINKFISVFLSVFILSMICFSGINTFAEKYPDSGFPGINEKSDESLSLKLFGAVIFGAIIMLLIMKLSISSIFIKIIEMIIVCSSIAILTFSILHYFLFEYAFTISVLIGVSFAILRMKKLFRNEIAILSTAGVSGIIAYAISPFSALILMAALSLYDVIAVFFTRHMQVLATNLSKQEASFSVKQTEKIIVNGEEHESYMEMGTGDLLVPGIVVASFLKIGIVPALFAIFGTIIGFYALIYALSKYRNILPALPFILGGVFFSYIAYIISYIFYGLLLI